MCLEFLPIVGPVDKNPRRDKTLAQELEAEAKRQNLIHMVSPEKVRYRERTTAERANARLKDEFGGRMVRVRGHTKVLACQESAFFDSFLTA